MKGKAMRGNVISYGEYGLVALEPAWVTSNQIEKVQPHPGSVLVAKVGVLGAIPGPQTTEAISAPTARSSRVAASTVPGWG
jgi:hypothetical protein